MAKNNAPAIFISATERSNIKEFRELLTEEVKKVHGIRYPNYIASNNLLEE